MSDDAFVDGEPEPAEWVVRMRERKAREAEELDKVAVPVVSPSSSPDDLRAQLGDSLSATLGPEAQEFLITQVLAYEKQAWVHCPSCKKKSLVKIPDAKAVVPQLAELLNQAKGRPGQAAGAEDAGTTVNYRVVNGGHEMAKQIRAWLAEARVPSAVELEALVDGFGYQ